MTLSSILSMTSSDKQSLHGYGDIYGPIFEHLRERPVRFLEIGILGGDGLVAFSKFFSHPGSKFVGCDIHDRRFVSNDSRITTIYGDASQAMFLSKLPGPFTICLEDASHMASMQITVFEAVWPMIEPGGFYCCEDLHSCHSPQHRDAHLTFIEYLARVATQMQDPAGAMGSAKPNPDHPWPDIETITIYKGVAVIRKRA